MLPRVYAAPDVRLPTPHQEEPKKAAPKAAKPPRGKAVRCACMAACAVWHGALTLVDVRLLFLTMTSEPKREPVGGGEFFSYRAVKWRHTHMRSLRCLRAVSARRRQYATDPTAQPVTERLRMVCPTWCPSCVRVLLRLNVRARYLSAPCAGARVSAALLLFALLCCCPLTLPLLSRARCQATSAAAAWRARWAQPPCAPARAGRDYASAGCGLGSSATVHRRLLRCARASVLYRHAWKASMDSLPASNTGAALQRRRASGV